MFEVKHNTNGEVTLPMVRAAAPADADQQVLTAWILARRCAHHWWVATVNSPQREEGVEHVPTSWAEAWECWSNYIQPLETWEIGCSPSGAHVTGTGRIQWGVLSDGSVELEIHRPTGAVCGIRPDGKIWRAKPNSPTGAPQARHFRALSWFLRALGRVEAQHYAELADRLDGGEET